MTSTLLGSSLSALSCEICQTHIGSSHSPRSCMMRCCRGRPAGLAWGSPLFGSILHMLILDSNNHQNLWNLLMLMKIIAIWFQKHEIQRNIGGKNRRNRPLTPPTMLRVQPCRHGARSPARAHVCKSIFLYGMFIYAFSLFQVCYHVISIDLVFFLFFLVPWPCKKNSHFIGDSRPFT